MPVSRKGIEVTQSSLSSLYHNKYHSRKLQLSSQIWQLAVYLFCDTGFSDLYSFFYYWQPKPRLSFFLTLQPGIMKLFPLLLASLLSLLERRPAPVLGWLRRGRLNRLFLCYWLFCLLALLPHRLITFSARSRLPEATNSCRYMETIVVLNTIVVV